MEIPAKPLREYVGLSQEQARRACGVVIALACAGLIARELAATAGLVRVPHATAWVLAAGVGALLAVRFGEPSAGAEPWVFAALVAFLAMDAHATWLAVVKGVVCGLIFGTCVVGLLRAPASAVPRVSGER